jgi:drug/metabolite transporter (DMT)-like permease
MTTPRAVRIDAATLALLTLPPLFWAGNAIVGRLAVGLIAPMALNALRWLLAGLVLLPFVWRDVLAHRAVIRRQWLIITTLGILGMGSYNALQYLALTTSTPTNVTLIAASAPLFTLALGALFFSEGLDARRVVGAIFSIVGVALVMVRGDLARLWTLSFVIGDVFMLVAAALWSLYTWILRVRRPALPALVLLFAQILLGSLFYVGCAVVERYVFHGESHFDTSRAWLVLAYVAVFPSVLGYVLWDHGVARAGATVPVFFANLTPIFAAVLSALLLAEGPQWYHAVGLVLILIGVRMAGRRAEQSD